MYSLGVLNCPGRSFASMNSFIDRGSEIVKERLREVDLSRPDIGVTQKMLGRVSVETFGDVISEGVAERMRCDPSRDARSPRNCRNQLAKRMRGRWLAE